MNDINIYDVVKKLVGGIEPVGSADVDAKKYENLEVMINLVDELLGNIINVSCYAENDPDSIKEAGIRADQFIQEICHNLIVGGYYDFDEPKKEEAIKTLLHVEKVKDNRYKIIHENGVHFADAIRMEDGFFEYWPAEDRGHGYMGGYMLRMIADELDKLNEPYVKFLESQGMY